MALGKGRIIRATSCSHYLICKNHKRFVKIMQCFFTEK